MATATRTPSSAEVMSDVNLEVKDIKEFHGVPQDVMEEEGEEEESPPAPYQLERPILLGLIVESYVGEYVDSLYSGEGVAHFVGGNVYEGTFVAGRMHGKGKYRWTTGVEYDGDFRDNVISGQGVFRWTNGCIYEGEVANGLRCGHGTLRHEPSGVSYVGNWLNGKKHGQGRMDYDADGRSFYEGDWHDNLKHGWGIRQYESGNIYEGMWYKHQRQGEGKMIWRDRKGGKEIFVGQWEAGIQHGKGKHVWFYKRVASSQYPIRNSYEGDFVRGARDGHGMFFYASGAIYDGCWKDNLKHGPGKFVFKNGRIYEGIFEYDHMVEHPDLVLERLSTPEFSKVRTRSPTVHESELYQSRCGSVNTMSPSFKVDLTTFEDKIAPSVSLPDEIEQVQRVIMHHVTPLRKIYNKYATLGNEASPDNTYVLNRMQFWRLLKDAQLHSPDLTLCIMDRALSGGTTGLSVHEPFRKIMFREFVHNLLTLAHLIYAEEVASMKGSALANSLNQLVEGHLLLHACKIKGQLYVDDRRSSFALHFAPEAYKVYTFFCDPKKNPKFSDATLRQRDFMFMMKDLYLIDDHFTAQALIGLLASDTPGILDPETGNFSLEGEMTFLDFFEALVGCSQLAPLAHYEKKGAGKSALFMSARASYLEEEEDAGERAGSASHPSGDGGAGGERSGSQTAGSQAEGTAEEDKDSGEGGEAVAAATNEGGGAATGSGSRAGTGTPGGPEMEAGLNAGVALSPEQEGRLEGESAHSQDGGASPSGEGPPIPDSPKKSPSRRSRTVVSSQAGDELGFQGVDAPSPRGSAMGLMEQILHTTDADEKALMEEQMMSPEEAEFHEWCAKLRKFFELLFFPAAREYKQICKRCFDQYGHNFLNVDMKSTIEKRLAEAALEEEEGEEEEGDCEDDVEEDGGEGETRRPSFKTNASNNASGIKGVGGFSLGVPENFNNKVSLNVASHNSSRRASTQPSQKGAHN